jgi:hypothetical protein
MEDWLRDTVPLRLQERPEVLPPEFTLGVVRPQSSTTVSGLDTRLLAIFRSRLPACTQSIVWQTEDLTSWFSERLRQGARQSLTGHVICKSVMKHAMKYTTTSIAQLLDARANHQHNMQHIT